MMDGLMIQGRSPAAPGPFAVRHWLDVPPSWAQAQSRPRVVHDGGEIPGCRVVGWDAESLQLEATHPHTPFLAFCGHLGRRAGPYGVASLGDALKAAGAIRGNAGKGATLAAAALVESAARHAIVNPQDGQARSLAELDALQLAADGPELSGELSPDEDDQAGDLGLLAAVLDTLRGSLDASPAGWKDTRGQLRKVPDLLVQLMDLLEAERRHPAARAGLWNRQLESAAKVAADVDATRPFGAAWTP